MKNIKQFILSVIEVIQDARQLQAEELKKRYFQR
jgi:hypothetical protein